MAGFVVSRPAISGVDFLELLQIWWGMAAFAMIYILVKLGAANSPDSRRGGYMQQQRHQRTPPRLV
jgi:hypothetical protein